MKPLNETVAVVSGATRGAGRGVAVALGEAGATVYVTGRSSMATGSTNGWPGTIEATAEAVTAAGGRGIPVRVDHDREAEVAALFQRVKSEQGRLDLLVNNAWGGHDVQLVPDVQPFWALPTTLWDGMITRGARLALLAATHAIPMMLGRGRGLIVNTSFWDRDRYTGTLYYDLGKATINRLTFGMAQDLKPHGVAVLAVSPGWMRTELVLKAYDTDEAHWQEVEALQTTESPLYVGRAVASLASDPAVFAKTGRVWAVGDLARAYGFTDADGRQPEPFRLVDAPSPA